MVSFDLIGFKEKAVAIVEIVEGLEKSKIEIAKEIMEKNKNIKSVLEKVSRRKGKLRKREYKILAGDKNTEVLHREFGYTLKVDPQKVYFSPRESTERQRIAVQVKAGETILVMFGGICVMSIAIAKKQPNVNKIYSVELNPDGSKYALENVRMNKLSHKIVPIEGDVKTGCREFYNKCDRILMPLPLGAEKFLDIAVKCLKSEGGIIHFYTIGKEEDLFSAALETIGKKLKRLKKTYTVINKRKVLAYSPRQWKVCIDLMVK
ncbi:MAG: class I SAM-dependent methyltransferase family protein [Candidatus Aenigmarchaeota archaeon]|nr:class I SAM-dependent methyltransferase family protein [Candidatus Aenigmarchaeota archaeon]